MQTHRGPMASLSVSALLMGLGLAMIAPGQLRAAGAASAQGLGEPSARLSFDESGAPPQPFAPPAPFAVSPGEPLPSLDTTGSIATGASTQRAVGAAQPEPGSAASAPMPIAAHADAPTPIVLPPPDLPGVPVVDPPQVAAAANPAALDLAEALKAFTGADLVRRPAENAAQFRQRQAAREAIATFYAAHANAPLWVSGDHFSAAARAALAQIDRAGEDGLNLAAYAVPALSSPDQGKLASGELALSEAVVAYAVQATGGRINPLQIDRLITAKPVVADPAEVLAAVPGAVDPAATLRNYNPPQPAYAALRTKLAELRQQATPMARESIPSGPTLKLGMRDPRVALIRSRFGLDSAAASPDDGLVYDVKVAAAVAEFQRTNGLPPSGTLNAKTIEALSGGNPGRLENELIANMERWRWMPRDLGTDHVSVNIPDYSLEVVKGDTVVHRARVVVGKPDHQTPVFSDAMRFIIVNPYWNVPLSIIKKEMMPKLATDPDYFANHGYEVVERDGVTYVRQPPGDDNALGRIKFMFPNEHSVYLHDTNARALFGRDKRAFSHGCVRVDQPFKLAEVVLGPERGWTEKRVKAMLGGNERTINLPAPLPIHITYFTAFVSASGKLELRDDVYGYSARVKSALALRD